MKYDMLKPCNLCPFRRDNKGLHGLHPSTAEMFGREMLDSQGAPFVCHKTAKLDDESGEFVDAGDSSKHCAGGLIFAEKNETMHQMGRIAERLGMYDARKLMSQSKAILDSVFDDLDEMIAANRFTAVRRAKRATKKRRRHA